MNAAPRAAALPEAAAWLAPARRGIPGGRVMARLARDPVALAAGAMVAAYTVIAIGVWAGLWAGDWSRTGARAWVPASAEHWFGTNQIGQDIFQRALAGTATALEIGVLVALVATAAGALLGAAAGLRPGGWWDELLLWMAGVVDSIPFFLFVAAVAFAMDGAPGAMQVAMVAAFWTTTARLVRAEVMRLRHQPFVEASRALGLSNARILFRHLLPNTWHVLLVQVVLVFVAAVKAEVILSFLGLGVKDDVSWGLMLAESTQEVTLGQYNNFLAASGMLVGLVLALNLFADRLQDALDPRTAR